MKPAIPTPHCRPRESGVQGDRTSLALGSRFRGNDGQRIDCSEFISGQVLSDSNLVIAEMEKLAGAISATLTSVQSGSRSITVHVVKYGKNTFNVVEQSWDEDMVRGFEESGTYRGLPILKFR